MPGKVFWISTGVTALAFSYAVAFGQQNPKSCQIVNNEFAITPFEVGSVTTENVEKITVEKLVLTKLPVKNQFSEQVDTLYSYKSPRFEIVFWSGNQREFMRTALITDPGVVFRQGIRIGDLKVTVLKKLNASDKDRCDMVLITDEENFDHQRLHFESGILVKVTLNFGMN